MRSNLSKQWMAWKKRSPCRLAPGAGWHHFYGAGCAKATVNVVLERCPSSRMTVMGDTLMPCPGSPRRDPPAPPPSARRGYEGVVVPAGE